jgi:hypothetical protein
VTRKGDGEREGNALNRTGIGDRRNARIRIKKIAQFKSERANGKKENE